MLEVNTTNLTEVSFTNQEQLHYSNWKDVVQGRDYRTFTHKSETGEHMQGRGFAPCTIQMTYLCALPLPFRSAMYRRKSFPGLVAMSSKHPRDKLALRATHYAAANSVLVEAGKHIKSLAERQGAQSTASHIWVNQAWHTLKPVLEQREREPEKFWPKIMRTRPLVDRRADIDLKTGRWQHWTIHFAPWCEGFKVRDIATDAPADTSQSTVLAVKAASYALDFLANYAPFSFIYCMNSYAGWSGGEGVALALLERTAAQHGPEACRAAFERKQEALKALVHGKASKNAKALAAEKTHTFQRLNRAERFRQIREEKAQLLMLAPKHRDNERLEALKQEASNLNHSPYNSIPLTEEQELEIQEILASVKKCVDAANL